LLFEDSDFHPFFLFPSLHFVLCNYVLIGQLVVLIDFFC
jgi:hypothetical protein